MMRKRNNLHAWPDNQWYMLKIHKIDLQTSPTASLKMLHCFLSFLFQTINVKNVETAGQ